MPFLNAILKLITIIMLLDIIRRLTNRKVIYYKNIVDFLEDKPASKWKAYLTNGIKVLSLESGNTTQDQSLRIVPINKLDLFSSSRNFLSGIDYSMYNSGMNEMIIHYVFTISNFKRRGLATKLIQIAETDAISKGVTMSKLYIHENKLNYGFYQKLGYVYSYNQGGEHIRWINPHYIQMMKILK